MSPARARPSEIDGAYDFEPTVYRDERGLFSSTYQEAPFAEALGKPLFPVRDVSHNRSARGVLRGIHHSTTPPGRAKYVFCQHGRVRDYLVDLRLGSPTFGRCSVLELSGENCIARYVPMGVGHAFLSLEDDSVVTYLLSGGYVPEHEKTVSPLDPELGLPIPEDLTPLFSDRDLAAPTVAQARIAGELPDFDICQKVEADLWT